MKENKQKVSFRFNKMLNQRLGMIAHKLAVSKTAIVETAINQMLNKLEQELQQ